MSNNQRSCWVCSFQNILSNVHLFSSDSCLSSRPRLTPSLFASCALLINPPLISDCHYQVSTVLTKIYFQQLNFSVHPLILFSVLGLSGFGISRLPSSASGRYLKVSILHDLIWQTYLEICEADVRNWRFCKKSKLHCKVKRWF